MALVNWHLEPCDQSLVDQIVERAIADYGGLIHETLLRMDLSAAVNTNPGIQANLGRLLAATPFDFGHDILGIQANINRSTGEIRRFLPRCVL